MIVQEAVQAHKKWPMEFRVVLTNGIAALKGFVECRGLENRMSVNDAQIRSARKVVDANVVAFDNRSASLEAELASAGKVRDLLK